MLYVLECVGVKALIFIKKSRYDSVRGEVLYEVKWRGYPDTENTWEPRENLLPYVEQRFVQI